MLIIFVVLWSLGLDRPLAYFLVLLHNVFAVMYYIFLCFAVYYICGRNKLCYVMLCYVMLCYVMLCYVMLCYVMLGYSSKNSNIHTLNTLQPGLFHYIIV